jgi:hypothetical protein
MAVQPTTVHPEDISGVRRLIKARKASNIHDACAQLNLPVAPVFAGMVGFKKVLDVSQPQQTPASADKKPVDRSPGASSKTPEATPEMQSVKGGQFDMGAAMGVEIVESPPRRKPRRSRRPTAKRVEEVILPDVDEVGSWNREDAISGEPERWASSYRQLLRLTGGKHTKDTREMLVNAGHATFLRRNVDEAWIRMLKHHPDILGEVVKRAPKLTPLAVSAAVSEVTVPDEEYGLAVEKLKEPAAKLSEALVKRRFYPPNFVPRELAEPTLERVVWDSSKKAAKVYNPFYNKLKRKAKSTDPMQASIPGLH